MILFGRMAPAPPAYMLPPQMPSRLNEIPYRAIFSMVNGSSEMYRATPTFSAATFMSVFSAAFFSAAVSSGESGSMPWVKPLTSGVLPSGDTSDASILIWRHAGLSTARLFDP